MAIDTFFPKERFQKDIVSIKYLNLNNKSEILCSIYKQTDCYGYDTLFKCKHKISDIVNSQKVFEIRFVMKA